MLVGSNTNFFFFCEKYKRKIVVVLSLNLLLVDVGDRKLNSKEVVVLPIGYLPNNLLGNLQRNIIVLLLLLFTV